MWEAALQIVAQEAAEAASIEEAATLALAAMAANGLAPSSMSASHVYSQPGLHAVTPATLTLVCATFAHGRTTRAWRLSTACMCASHQLGALGRREPETTHTVWFLVQVTGRGQRASP